MATASELRVRELPRNPSLFREKVVEIAGKRIAIGGPLPKPREGEKLVKVTNSLCPHCYRLLPAIVVEREGKVYIRRTCPEHGETEEIYYGDAEIYHRFEKWERDGSGTVAHVNLAAPCPFSCGLCPLHKSHTALVNLVVTNRCDLTCWYCFFYAEKAGYVYEPTLEQIKFMIEQVKREGVPVAVQLTGGEPTMRDDLPEIIRLLRELGVRHIQLNTHGIKFAELYIENPQKAVEYTRSLRYLPNGKMGVNTVYLSFDGITPETNPKNHWEVPYTFAAFRKGGMTSVVLVPTVIKNWNLHEVGDIVKFAAYNMDIVRGVNFQPVSLTGLMPRKERNQARVTIPDLIKALEEQTDGQIRKEHWYPVPVTVAFSRFMEAFSPDTPHFEMTNHPMCGAATYVYVERKGKEVKFVPLPEFVDVEGLAEYLEEKAKELEEGGRLTKAKVGMKVLYNLRKFIDQSKAPEGFDFWKILYNVLLKRNYSALAELHYKLLYLGSMHFMDLYNYDVQRVMRCNIHYTSPEGRVIPFCTYNVLNDIYRDYIIKRYSMSLEEAEKRLGKNALRKYVRNVKKLSSGKEYLETYKYFLDEIKSVR